MTTEVKKVRKFTGKGRPGGNPDLAPYQFKPKGKEKLVQLSIRLPPRLRDAIANCVGWNDRFRAELEEMYLGENSTDDMVQLSIRVPPGLRDAIANGQGWNDRFRAKLAEIYLGENNADESETLPEELEGDRPRN